MNPVLHHGDALNAYHHWPTPTLIISDGAYGVAGFPGDPRTPDRLADWYRPHVQAWTAAATNRTSLWFWNTEIGWANTHGLLAEHGWRYVQTCIWDKGAGHIAGRVNTRTVRTFPVTTEIAVLYERYDASRLAGRSQDMRDWMRDEWARTGLPWREANTACGVKDAATRKYLAADDTWYMPSPDKFRALADYANTHSNPDGRPYFAGDPEQPDHTEWDRRVWNYVDGLRNVWTRPTLRGTERVRTPDGKNLHLNQKPLDLIEPLVLASSDPGDIVWEPFGGLGSATIAATIHGRFGYIAEQNPDYVPVLTERLTACSDRSG